MRDTLATRIISVLREQNTLRESDSYVTPGATDTKEHIGSYDHPDGSKTHIYNYGEDANEPEGVCGVHVTPGGEKHAFAIDDGWARSGPMHALDNDSANSHLHPEVKAKIVHAISNADYK